MTPDEARAVYARYPEALKAEIKALATDQHWSPTDWPERIRRFQQCRTPPAELTRLIRQWRTDRETAKRLAKEKGNL